jgi:hypothetical protein
MEQKDNDSIPNAQPSYDDYVCWAMLEGILDPMSESQFNLLMDKIQKDDFSDESMQ